MNGEKIADWHRKDVPTVAYDVGMNWGIGAKNTNDD